MPALIENNYIYIAQPPLYRVSRKKTSRYIHSEREMDDYLLELGQSDVKIQLPNQQEPLERESMQKLVASILELEAFIFRIERKGIPFREFLALRNEQGRFPRFQINLLEGPCFAYSEDEFVELRKSEEENQRLRHDATLASIPVEEITEEMKIFRPSRLHFVELFEEDFFQELQTKLDLYALQIQDYTVADGVLLSIIDDAHKGTPYFTLKEVIEFFRENGRKGIEIQRYKGLGEMNADQLWETTMDPQFRTLIKVTLPDVIAADHMFSMLMGEDVPPRRAFIEQHALSVKNLDI
jgi:DNA gyrase subunit B